MPTAPPSPQPRRARPHGLLLAATLVASVAMVPPVVGVGSDDGADVTLLPAVLRTGSADADLALAVGGAAPADVVVDLALRVAEVDEGGSVSAGGPAPGSLSAGSRLRPGERLGIAARGLAGPTLVVATVTPADGSGPASTVTALVLPAPLGDPVTATVAVADGVATAEVTAATPTVVTVRLHGATTLTAPDRLVLPDRPLRLTGEAAGWPLATEVVVVDEGGRVVRTGSGGGALGPIAAASVVAAALAAVVSLRRRRDRVAPS